jgi:hypothetical protein
MKRAGKKCVEKKPFNNRLKVEAQVIKNFIYNKKSYGIYKCPTCLDFHTTSKYDNRSKILKHKCEKLKKKWYKKPTTRRDQWLSNVLMIHTLDIKKGKTKVNKTPPKPKSKRQLEKKKRLEYKKSILPLAKQRELLALLDNSKLSTGGRFWRWILGIIK